MVEVYSLLYDKDGNRVSDEAAAVRGVIVEVDDRGRIKELDRWQVATNALAGDEGELATRPPRPRWRWG